MKHFAPAAWLYCMLISPILYGQSPKIDREAFFEDTSVLNVKIVTNMSKIINNHTKNGTDFPGHFLTTLADSTAVDDQVLLEVRGNFRLSFCYLPPIRVVFNYNESSVLHSFKTLKLVNECKVSRDYDQYVLKEYLTYRIYNLLTDMSFRARLLNLTWQDSAAKKKPIAEHAFLLEDIKDVAKRNDCTVWKRAALHQELSNRKQMTLVALFQYMIGNTDWGASVNHNQRLILSKQDSLGRPFAVPYDFDWTGFVNPEYAFPDEKLGIENVRQRLYRGFPRSMSELNEAFAIFNKQKENIYALIQNFNLLLPSTKKDLTSYLDDFYRVINDQDLARFTFIDNARKQ